MIKIFLSIYRVMKGFRECFNDLYILKKQFSMSSKSEADSEFFRNGLKILLDIGIEWILRFLSTETELLRKKWQL